jgi:hypothetical protein
MLIYLQVLLSLIGLASGLVLISSFIRGRQSALLNVIFLSTTAATNITGFFFPFHGVTPGIVIALVSLPVLTLGTLALMKKWARVFMIASVFTRFLNVLVFIAQILARIPALRIIAKGYSPAVGVTQLLALLAHVVLGVIIIRRFRYRLN